MDSPHSFRPLTLAILLSCITVVINYHDTDSAHILIPMENLDPSQFILIRWGGVVPACWKLWKDQRVAHVEAITYLVSELPFGLYFVVDECLGSQLVVSSRSLWT